MKMHHFPTSAVLSLAALGHAIDLGNYQAQFQNYLGKVVGNLPIPGKQDAAGAGAAEAKAGRVTPTVLTLDNWKETLYAPVTAESTTAEEWWVLITGGNKTCFGRCVGLEKAYNQTMAKLGGLGKGPHSAILNCEDQPVLCNAWSAPTGALWIFEMLPKPAPIDIWYKRFNLTSVTSDDLLQLSKEGYKSKAKLHDGYFHPFDGPLAQNRLAIPIGYILWGFGLVPSWLFMVVVSMVSRTMMSNRMQAQVGQRRPAPGAPGAAGAAT